MPIFGVSMFPTDYAIQPIELSKAVEERGLNSLFFPEHTHIPTSRKTPFPGGTELPKEYWHTHDPFVALGAAAAVTKKLLLGTGVCLVIERDPITLAKEVASLDLISGGRVILGIGGGWNVEEMANHGTDPKKRWKRLRESVLAMRQIWTQEAAEYHGEIVNFDPIWCYPKPVQPGGPPVMLGSNGKRFADRVANYCDGWFPINNPRVDVAENLKLLRAAAQRVGRKFETIKLAMFGVGPKEDRARELIGLGFEHLVFGLPAAPAATVLPLLDTYAELARKLK
jgi:probable F420-dependent oxidoreductase